MVPAYPCSLVCAKIEGMYSLGLDYGTSSVRCQIVRCSDGAHVGFGTWDYAHGVIEDPNDPLLARQHPADYLEGARQVIRQAIDSTGADFQVSNIVGIGVDTTGSTPIPVNANGVALAMLPEYEGDKSALAWLWKDHTAHAEAAEITECGQRYMDMVGGTYSSEWFWSKILHCKRVAPHVFEAAYSWMELCDFVPAWLTGEGLNVKRSICAAGHKALYSAPWGGLPDVAFLDSLEPGLGVLRSRLYEHAFTSDTLAGNLDTDVALQLGLPAGIPVAVGAFDAHMGAVGSGVRPGVLVKILGTSTCDIMVTQAGDNRAIPGMCGVVPGSVLPGMLGIEAGQSAVGDLFAWYVRHLGGVTHEQLSTEAAKLRPGQSGLLALDWNNGNRTILVDQRLTGLLMGQTLSTTQPEVFRALIEATAFGALKIIERMEEYGAVIRDIVCCGGVAEKSPLVMQIYADVTGRVMKISRSAESCALGAAIFGSVVGGAHPDVIAAQNAMTGTKDQEFTPNPKAHAVYRQLYRIYCDLHDAFGGVTREADLGGAMKQLIEIRKAANQ